MTFKNNATECGPVIACGAAAVRLDHKPGDPTFHDEFAAAVKRFFRGEASLGKRSGAEATYGESSRQVAHSHVM